MRKFVYLTTGTLEIIIGVVLIVFACQLPSVNEVESNFTTAENVTVQTGDQVHMLRGQIKDLRKSELHHLSVELEQHSRIVSSNLTSGNLNYRLLKAIADALGEIALGMEGVADTLNPVALGQMGKSLEVIASYLDKNVIPGANKAADDLEEATKQLQQDTKRLTTLMGTVPLDLKTVREIHDSLGRFSETMTRISSTLDTERLKTMKEGFEGMESALSSGADQVEKLAGYSYPVVTFKGLKPYVELRPFWSDGDNIAAGMRKAAAGSKAAGKEIDAMMGALPRIQGTFDDGKRIVQQTRESLGFLLKHEDKLEPILRDLPVNSAKMAEQLPKVGMDLAATIRSTEQLKEVATALRQTKKGMDETAHQWPVLNKSLLNSAGLLRKAQEQMNQTLENREQYEEVMKEMVGFVNKFAQRLPVLIQQLQDRLEQQEKALADLEDNLQDAGKSIPEYSRTTVSLLRTARLLVLLLAALAGIHGTYTVVAEGRGGRKG